jgi:hypothetical protein
MVLKYSKNSPLLADAAQKNGRIDTIIYTSARVIYLHKFSLFILPGSNSSRRHFSQRRPEDYVQISKAVKKDFLLGPKNAAIRTTQIYILHGSLPLYICIWHEE